MWDNTPLRSGIILHNDVFSLYVKINCMFLFFTNFVPNTLNLGNKIDICTLSRVGEVGGDLEGRGNQA